MSTQTNTPYTGLSAVRLCTMTHQISPPEPVEMNNEGHEDSDKPCYWNVVFDMPIPGWLPPSTTYGVEDAGVRYTLLAEAKFTFIGENDTSSFFLSSLCSPFRSRTRTVHTRKRIQIKRLIAPYEDADTEGDMVLQPRISYLINAKVAKNSQFPPEVLESLQVLTTVPEHVNIERRSFPVTIRMRTKGLDAEKCKRLQVASVSVNIIQKENYRQRATPEYWRRYPLPSPSRQCPDVPLLDPHHWESELDSGLGHVVWSDRRPVRFNDEMIREFSLLPPGEPGFYSLGDNNYPFIHDAETTPEEATWYTLESTIPFVHQAPDDDADIVEWGGHPIIRSSVVSPLVVVSHRTDIELNCTYTAPGSEEAVTERLAFSLPFRFQYFAPDPRIQSTTVPPPMQQVPTQSGSPVPSLPPTKSYTASLPAYSQLFDRNGDRKIDYTIPLPLYTPQASPDASPNASSCSLDLGRLDLGDEDEGQEMQEMDPLLASRYDYDSE
ncbi:hypothetical protein DXG01_016400 [Tephrocybe rancida]|nr:hypothetical protein DXG01_016400 [Tephrocybe rancida]